jgi:hypothetical protein
MFESLKPILLTEVVVVHETVHIGRVSVIEVLSFGVSGKQEIAVFAK